MARRTKRTSPKARKPAPKRRAPAEAPPRVRPARQASPRDWERTLALRELFWHNVVREVLTSLAILSAQRDAEPAPAADAAAAPRPDDVLDGRFAVITTAGVRVAIAHVTPMFACGIPGTAAQRALSIAVECSVFQILSPSGEQHTLPIHEIRSLHALTPELMRQLEEAARAELEAEGGDAPSEPFGFAAFTSLSRSALAGGEADADDDTQYDRLDHPAI